MNTLLKNLRNVSGSVNNLVKNGVFMTRIQSFAVQYELPISWVRPKKIAATDPRKSGDGGINHNVKSNELGFRYSLSEELKTADDIVKRMFTLEYLPKGYIEQVNRERTMALVKRHDADRGSMESKLAALTSEILYLQGYLIEHPRNKQTKHFLKELIDKRRKFLGKLRRWDYKRFEWILEKLNLVFKPHPLMYHPIQRKPSIRKLATRYCDEIRQKKFDAYRAELESQHANFFKEKAESLAFIRAEEIACGVTPTVTEEEIEAAEKKAKEYQ